MVHASEKASLLIIGMGGLGLWALRWTKTLLSSDVKVVVADTDVSHIKCNATSDVHCKIIIFDSCQSSVLGSKVGDSEEGRC